MTQKTQNQQVVQAYLTLAEIYQNSGKLMQPGGIFYARQNQDSPYLLAFIKFIRNVKLNPQETFGPQTINIGNFYNSLDENLQNFHGQNTADYLYALSNAVTGGIRIDQRSPATDTLYRLAEALINLQVGAGNSKYAMGDYKRVLEDALLGNYTEPGSFSPSSSFEAAKPDATGSPDATAKPDAAGSPDAAGTPTVASTPTAAEAKATPAGLTPLTTEPVVATTAGSLEGKTRENRQETDKKNQTIKNQSETALLDDRNLNEPREERNYSDDQSDIYNGELNKAEGLAQSLKSKQIEETARNTEVQRILAAQKAQKAQKGFQNFVLQTPEGYRHRTNKPQRIPLELAGQYEEME
ncbi:hypothetical protein HY605_06265, partial [Candidatus Peregrinibacteria bacterium]|nr:hypothetical protein [Candidatus Peregrinibacteria bacterium]